MAKVTRSVLKEIVKECLLEILFEGIDSEPGKQFVTEAKRPRSISSKNSQMERIQKKRRELDSQRVDTRKKQHITENIIPALTNDPIMTEILSDTAATTLQEQGMSNAAGPQKGYVPGDSVQRAIYDKDPSDLFDGAENWAALAFSAGNKNH